MREGTRILQAGVPPAVQGEPLLPGPVFASVYHLPGDPEGSPYQYGRYDNPTWSRFEAALESLEGGPTVAFASGMAAAYAVMQSVLQPGDTMVITGDAYYTSRSVAAEHLPARNIEVREIPEGGDLDAAAQGARLVWIETPSNPSLNAYDIAGIAELVHEAGGLLAVDNTTPTVAGQRPLELGADLSIASDSKALTGHSDLVLGHVATTRAELADGLRRWRLQTGSIPGPMEIWLAHRSLATLDVRLERMCGNAMQVAETLAARDDLVQVRYPGLESDPSHAVARRQMRGYGPIVGFELATEQAAQTFLGCLEVITEATSFGGVHSTAERRARWGGDRIGEGFIRLSVGCEDVADLLEDLDQALDKAQAS